MGDPHHRCVQHHPVPQGLGQVARHLLGAPGEPALLDAYPRVRIEALSALATAPDSFEVLASSLRDDKWFLVRAAALDGLPNEPRSQPLATAALHDHLAR